MLQAAFESIKTDASTLGSSVVDNFNEALQQKTIAKIVVPVEMAVSGAGTSERWSYSKWCEWWR